MLNSDVTIDSGLGTCPGEASVANGSGNSCYITLSSVLFYHLMELIFPYSLSSVSHIPITTCEVRSMSFTLQTRKLGNLPRLRQFKEAEQRLKPVLFLKGGLSADIIGGKCLRSPWRVEFSWELTLLETAVVPQRPHCGLSLCSR